MAEMPDIEDKFAIVALEFRKCMEQPSFRTALDKFSVDIMDVAEQFVESNMDYFKQHMQPFREELILSAVCGWILGMPGGRLDLDEAGRQKAIVGHISLAAFVSAWSAENSRRGLTRLVN